MTGKEYTYKININPRIYPIDLIYSSASMFLDKAFFFFEGNLDTEITVLIEPKEKETEGENLIKEFFNEVIVQFENSKRYASTKGIRDKFMNQVFEVGEFSNNLFFDTKTKEMIGSEKHIKEELVSSEKKSYLDDPEGIAVPWEEKYGKEEF
jgi:hypothetical protein